MKSSHVSGGVLPQQLGFAVLAILMFTLPFVALADVSGTTTLQANARLNLDTGTTVTSGGDLLWSGSTLTPQGSVGVWNFSAFGGSGDSVYASLTQASVTSVPAGLLSSSPIPSSSLAVGTILLARTNGGNYAKVLVTANSGGSLSLQFTTYGASAGGGGGGGGGTGPALTITAVENAATNIPPGLPNGAIAQGALFVVKGTNLGPAAVAIAQSFPLLTTIGGISAQVTVGGTTVDAIMYYSLDKQISAVLPSKTPTGTGTIKVTYNGGSASAPITVVQSNVGIFTVSQTGSGDAIAFLADNGLVGVNHAANPGDVVTFWGTGLGPVTSDETKPALGGDMPSVPLQVFIGGK